MNIPGFTTIAKFVQAVCMQLHGHNKCWNRPIGLQEYWIGWEVRQVSWDQIPRSNWDQQRCRYTKNQSKHFIVYWWLFRSRISVGKTLQLDHHSVTAVPMIEQKEITMKGGNHDNNQSAITRRQLLTVGESPFSPFSHRFDPHQLARVAQGCQDIPCCTMLALPADLVQDSVRKYTWDR